MTTHRVSTLVFVVVALGRVSWAEKHGGKPDDVEPADDASQDPPSPTSGSAAPVEPPQSDAVQVAATATAPSAQPMIISFARQSTVHLNGFMDLRNTTTRAAGEDASDRLAIQRARLLVSGNLGSPQINYLFVAGLGAGDFDPDSKTNASLHAVWVESTHIRDLNIRFGQQRPIVDRQRAVPVSAQQFVDRPPVIGELSVAQDFGLQVSSNDLFGLGERLKYRLFMGNGDGRNQQVATPIGFLYTARFELSPLGKFDDVVEGDFERTREPRLTIGLGGAYNQNAQRDRGNIGKYYTLGGFDYLYGAVDLTFKYAGISVIAETIYRRSNTLSRTSMDAAKTEYSRSCGGAFVQAGYMTERFVEVALRYSRLFITRTTDPVLEMDIMERGQELGGGLSWYVQHNHGLKLQTDYFYQSGVMSAKRHEMRMQVQASF